jgi:hypothetical protein
MVFFIFARFTVARKIFNEKVDYPDFIIGINPLVR